MEQIVQLGKEIKAKIPDTRLYIGFTGGTNIMAIAAGYSALILRVTGHYVLKEENEIIKLDPELILEKM